MVGKGGTSESFAVKARLHLTKIAQTILCARASRRFDPKERYRYGSEMRDEFSNWRKIAFGQACFEAIPILSNPRLMKNLFK